MATHRLLNMLKPGNWKTPSLWGGSEQAERRSSWLEVFFDVVFVATTFRLSEYLAGHLTWNGAWSFILMFSAMWVTWQGFTYYSSRFEADDTSQKLATLGMMIVVAVMAIDADTAIAGTLAFPVAYACGRVLLVLLWSRAGYHNPIARGMIARYTQGFSISAAIWSISMFASPPWRFVLWALALCVDMITPLRAVPQQQYLPSLHPNHLSERFGLFFIIVVGDVLLHMVISMSEMQRLEVHQSLSGVAGLMLAFSIWWLYFDYVMGKPTEDDGYWLVTWSYLHLPLVVAVVGMGTALRISSSSTDAAFASGLGWLMIASVLLATCITCIIGRISLHSKDIALENRRLLQRLFGVCAAAIPLAILLNLQMIPGWVCILALAGCVALQIVTKQ